MSYVWVVEVKIGKVWNPCDRLYSSRANARRSLAQKKEFATSGQRRIRRYIRDDQSKG